jgi:hypothetical protein
MALAILMAAAVLRGEEARGQEPAGEEPQAEDTPGERRADDEAREEERARRPGLANRAARSAIFPAWGQLSNGKPVKAVALFALETYLATGIIVESRRGAAKRRLADLAADEASEAELNGLADAHFDRRRNLIFWSVLAIFYGVADAYVDSHLGDFDKEIREGRELFTRIDPECVEIGVRF